MSTSITSFITVPKRNIIWEELTYFMKCFANEGSQKGHLDHQINTDLARWIYASINDKIIKTKIHKNKNHAIGIWKVLIKIKIYPGKCAIYQSIHYHLGTISTLAQTDSYKRWSLP